VRRPLLASIACAIVAACKGFAAEPSTAAGGDAGQDATIDAGVSPDAGAGDAGDPDLDLLDRCGSFRDRFARPDPASKIWTPIVNLQAASILTEVRDGKPILVATAPNGMGTDDQHTRAVLSARLPSIPSSLACSFELRPDKGFAYPSDQLDVLALVIHRKDGAATRFRLSFTETKTELRLDTYPGGDHEDNCVTGSCYLDHADVPEPFSPTAFHLLRFELTGLREAKLIEAATNRTIVQTTFREMPSIDYIALELGLMNFADKGAQASFANINCELKCQ
jgi:hypothetical protein